MGGHAAVGDHIYEHSLRPRRKSPAARIFTSFLRIQLSSHVPAAAVHPDGRLRHAAPLTKLRITVT